MSSGRPALYINRKGQATHEGEGELETQDPPSGKRGWDTQILLPIVRPGHPPNPFRTYGAGERNVVLLQCWERYDARLISGGGAEEVRPARKGWERLKRGI